MNTHYFRSVVCISSGLLIGRSILALLPGLSGSLALVVAICGVAAWVYLVVQLWEV